MQVQGGPEQVSLRGVHLPDTVPPLITRTMASSGELVGVGGTAGEEVEGSVQRTVLRLEEFLEPEGGHRGDLIQRLRGSHR